MRKKELALAVIERLKKEYPEAGCTLDYNEAWKLLVSVRLAAQCTDARVNVVVEKLYEKFPDVSKTLQYLQHLVLFQIIAVVARDMPVDTGTCKRQRQNMLHAHALPPSLCVRILQLLHR